MTGEMLYIGWLVASIGGVVVAAMLFRSAWKSSRSDMFKRPWHYRVHMDGMEWVFCISLVIPALFIAMSFMAWTKGYGLFPSNLFG